MGVTWHHDLHLNLQASCLLPAGVSMGREGILVSPCVPWAQPHALFTVPARNLAFGGEGILPGDMISFFQALG